MRTIKHYKGVNPVKKTLASGEEVTYYYAFKGGPRLPGKPGDPEFDEAYNAAHARKVQPAAGTLQSILNGFQSSAEWHDLAARTQSDYVKLIKVIEGKFGTFPLSALADKRTRGIFRAWRDERALKSRRQADYGWQVFARILSWAKEGGLVDVNPCERGGRVYRATRNEFVWTEENEAAFLASADEHLHLPLIIALWTGQRQGDLLKLTWMQYDGTYIRLRQGKTKINVTIPVGGPLKIRLDAARQKAGNILLNSYGEPWTPDGFRSSWGKACRAAGVFGVTFNDLRGTAVTRLALAGATEAEIATITGHTLREVRSILDANYLKRDVALAESAIRKLEARTNSPN
ncbi:MULTISPECIES: tyrosine-type recombinase/integrase [unclassified Rhizobium]|uniref:tyrosine-type recombinase/integrase n=1 Tax=unclassified Rhizobium TaxID=2613769 RepID=UPI0007E92980|nr:MULTISPECIES: tyrosine-type recombinase/integrase [unclassified Rhizobium]ANK84465.1 integrase/recombinase family protein [Rhizobium sp. N731]ANL14713.1 integrase/recombinase family protein [Rhizobium sp. N1314]